MDCSSRDNRENMIYVEMVGRMGNQMFSYAFARSLQLQYPKYLNEKIAFDFTNFVFEERDKNALSNYVCAENIVHASRKCSVIQRAVLFLFYRYKSIKKPVGEYELWLVERKWQDILNFFGIFICSFDYYEFKFKPISRNLLLIGYFESEKFFKKNINIIRDEYKPSSLCFEDRIQELHDFVEASESVCVGVRRGDFESENNLKTCSVCGTDYYNRAIEEIIGRVDTPKFVFFTDDPSWVSSNIKVPVGSKIVGDDFIDYDLKLYIMTMCKHFIISNSTYIWWAQCLSTNDNKVVIAPSKWRNNWEMMHKDIYDEKWILLDV